MPFAPISPKHKYLLAALFRLAILLFIAIIMVAFPQNIFPAAKRGIEAWWHVVFPGLFPFFVVSELLTRSGVVHFLSVFLEPVMRPFFNVSGAGALVLAAGYTSGAPIGGILTSDLRQQSLIDEEEAGRLVAFTNNASPLFMLSSIAIGFLGQPQLGWLLASSHYAANLCVGILLKYLSPKKTEPLAPHPFNRLFSLALAKMQQNQGNTAKPIGYLLGETIKRSVQNILTVGGFIIVFSVIIEILSILGFLNIISKLLGVFLLPLGFEPSLLLPLASGALEMTIGIKMIAESGTPLLQQLICISLLLGWAGIAIHAQVAAFVSESGIRLRSYFLARVLQSILAAGFTIILGYRVLPIISLELIVPVYTSWEIVLNSLKTMLFILASLLSISLLHVLLGRLNVFQK